MRLGALAWFGFTTTTTTALMIQPNKGFQRQSSTRRDLFPQDRTLVLIQLLSQY